MSDEKQNIIPPHQWTHNGTKVLLLKCVPNGGLVTGEAGGKQYSFQWPLEVGADVVAPDWNPEPKCGGGLHGWPWGLSVGDGKNPEYGETWIVFAASLDDVVDLGGKCKCRAATIVAVGTYLECLLRVHAGQVAWTQQSGAASATGWRGAASATGWRGAASATGESGAASATGWRGAASATGVSGAASATGESGAASATGESGAASATGWRGAASATGESGAASATGWRGAASATGVSGAASATGESGAASATGESGAASATGWRGAASATGWRGAAVATGENSTLEVGSTGLACTTAETVFWVIRTGAVLCQRTKKGVFVLHADEWKLSDGQVVLVEHGVIYTEW